MTTNRLLIITHSSSCWIIQPVEKEASKQPNDLGFRRSALKTQVIINRNDYYASIGLLDDDVLDIGMPPTPFSKQGVIVPDIKKLNIMASEIGNILSANEIPDVDPTIIIRSIISLMR